jgi:hypothetical protein
LKNIEESLKRRTATEEETVRELNYLKNRLNDRVDGLQATINFLEENLKTLAWGGVAPLWMMTCIIIMDTIKF